MLTGKRVAFLGGGNMAETMMQGLIHAGLVPRGRLSVSARRHRRLEELRNRFGVHTTHDNASLASHADILVLATKPQDLPTVLDEIRGQVDSETLVISIAAGITTAFIAARLGAGIPVVRVMPNTPSLVRAGAAAYCLGASAAPAHGEIAAEMFSAVGVVVRIHEDLMDAVTALSGTGPAYVYRLIEALTEAGEAVGIPREVAERLARQTVFGAGKMAVETGVPANELREQVTSPGGTTVAAMKVLSAGDFVQTLVDAVIAARDRARELGSSD